MIKDIFGKEVKIKDFIAYAVRNGNSAYLNVAIVRKFYDNNRLGLNILRIKHRNFSLSWSYKKENLDEQKELRISTGIVSSDEIMILPNDFLPENEKNFLLDSLCT